MTKRLRKLETLVWIGVAFLLLFVVSQVAAAERERQPVELFDNQADEILVLESDVPIELAQKVPDIRTLTLSTTNNNTSRMVLRYDNDTLVALEVCVEADAAALVTKVGLEIVDRNEAAPTVKDEAVKGESTCVDLTAKNIVLLRTLEEGTLPLDQIIPRLDPATPFDFQMWMR